MTETRPTIRARFFTTDTRFIQLCQSNFTSNSQFYEYIVSIHTDLLVLREECNAENTDICFVDTLLLKDKGLFYLREFQAKKYPIPVVALLEQDEWQAEKEVAREGVMHCLIKSRIDKPKFERTIRYARERKKVLDELHQRNLHYSWTGLPNRKLFLKQLRERIKGTFKPFAIALIDIDKFGRFNDVYGFSTGDKLLLSTANRLQQILGEDFYVSHSAGDQFLILSDKYTTEENFSPIIQDIENEFKRSVVIDEQKVSLKIRIGAVIVSEPVEQVDILLRNAARAAEKVKLEESKWYCFYQTEQVSYRHNKYISWETAIRKALQTEEFEVFYQPIVSLSNQSIVGFEALVRWHHPKMGMLFPRDFLSLAEQSGLTVPLGEYILKSVCAQAKYWEILGHAPLNIHINLSQKQFFQYDILKKMQEGIFHSSCNAAQIVLELSETTVMANPKSALSTMQELAEMGVKIVLDNFGVGQSSLVSINKFPLMALKIDQSFIRMLSVNKESRSIVDAVISMAGHLKKDVMVQGVETTGQLEFLKQKGCTSYQGFLYSPAITAGNFTRILQSHQKANVGGKP